MFVEAPLTNNLIITMHLVTLCLGLFSGYVYTGLIYHDQEVVDHCAIGNVLAFVTYFVLGAMIICVLGKCGELWRDINVSRSRTLFSMSDLFMAFCCFAMGAGYAGGIYPDNNTYNKCIIGNTLGWVSYGVLLTLITLRAYYVKRRAEADRISVVPTYAAVRDNLYSLNIEN